MKQQRPASRTENRLDGALLLFWILFLVLTIGPDLVHSLFR